jgi:competence protein ComEC
MWALSLMISLAAGEWRAGTDSHVGPACSLDVAQSVRVSCAMPLLSALGTHPAIRPLVTIGTLLMGWNAGLQLRDAANDDMGLRCDDPWSPSRRDVWRGPASLRVTAWPRPSGERWRAPVILLGLGDPDPDDMARPIPGEGAMISGDGQPPRLWQIVGGELELRRPRRATVPGGFSPSRFLQGRGVDWEGRLRNVATVPDTGLLGYSGAYGLAPLRDVVIRRLSRLFPPDEARLLQSVLLGFRTEGIQALRTAYATVGLGHLFAVSGLHVGLVAGVVLLILRGARAGRLALMIGLSLFLVVYVVLVGMPGSSLRAAALLIMTTLAGWAGRDHDGLRTLGLLLWIWALATPAALVDSGLRLSFGAAAGIIVTLRLVTPHLRDRPRGLRWLGNALAVSIGAQLGALPETARSFGWLHPLATLFNLVAVPSFSAAVWLAAGALLIPWPWLAESFASGAWLILRLLSAGAAMMSDTMDCRLGLPEWGPSAAAVFICGICGSVVCFRGHTLGVRLIGGLVVCSLLAIPFIGRTLRPGDMTTVQFDIGQGDCALFVFPDQSAVLIDTGETWQDSGPFLRNVHPWLRREGIDRLSGVILTHAHADHDGAALQVAAALPVDAWWLGGTTQAPAAGVAIRPSPGDTIHVGGDWSLVCVASPRNEPDENDRSLAVVLVHDRRIRGLWTGDLEAGGEQDLLGNGMSWPAEGIDVLKAGHHGSRTSSTGALLDTVRPGTILVSCGIENRHDHPSHGVFLACGDTISVLRTDLEGTIFVRWHKNGPPEIWCHASGCAQQLDTTRDGA